MKVTLSVAASPLAGSHLLTAICSPEAQVTSVQFFVDNAPVGTPDTSPSFTYLWDTTTVPDGVHYVEARASFTRSRTASSPRQQVDVLNAEEPPQPTQDPPANVILPVITGTTTEGQSLTVSPGEWTNEPTSFARQWLRCGGGGYSTEILADSPVAWWRMDNLDDASANSNTLTVVGSVPTVAGLIAGDSSFGRSFIGSTANYMTSVDHASLDLGDTFSLEAWVKLSALNTHAMIVSKGNNAYEWYVNSSTNQIVCGKSDVGAFVTSSIALTVGVVYHVVVTKAAGTAKLYINGVDRTGTTAAQTLANNAEVLAIGRYNESANFPFSGVIDEVAFYSTALSAARVLVHYNAGASAHGCAPIPSATGASYVLQNADVGKTVRVSVTAFNSAGASPTIETDETAAIASLSPSVPTIVSAPTLSGTTTVGDTISCSTGTWANSPTDYDYQWKRCTSAGGSCSDITGATSPSYVLASADAGSTVKCGVTASNAAGSSAQQNSNLSALVTTATQPPPSPDRYVYDFGSPTYDTDGWLNNTTNKGWNRLPTTPALASKADDTHIDYDPSVQVMQSVLGNNGVAGQCNTMRLTLLASDYADNGTKTNGVAQHTVVQIAGTNFDATIALPQYGSQPSMGMKPGQEWWYGWAFRTNAGYYPTSDTGNRISDAIFTLHNSLYGSQGWSTGANVQLGIGTEAPQGATLGTQWNQSTPLVNNHTPHLHVYIKGGNADSVLGSADHNVLHWLGPQHVPGTLYKIIWHIKWSQYLTGTFRCWINGQLVVNRIDNIANVYRRSSTGQVDTNIYPVFENYRAYNSLVNWTNTVYYGGLIRGSTMADVTIP